MSTYVVFVLSHLLLELVIAIANDSPDPVQTRLFHFFDRVTVAHLKLARLAIPRHL